MTWLDGKLEKQKRDDQREHDIKTHAPVLFKAVWNEIVSVAEEANQKGFNLKLNGNSERRRLNLLNAYSGEPTAFIELSLSRDRRALEVSGLRGERPHFKIDVCPDSIVCLHFDGEQKTPEEVAHIILDKFLF